MVAGGLGQIQERAEGAKRDTRWEADEGGSCRGDRGCALKRQSRGSVDVSDGGVSQQPAEDHINVQGMGGVVINEQPITDTGRIVRGYFRILEGGIENVNGRLSREQAASNSDRKQKLLHGAAVPF